MSMYNVHARTFAAAPERVGSLIDRLATSDDALWPQQCWPKMRFDRPLQVGARGGHGPIRYTVEVYDPGRYIAFRFHAPPGFHGYHAFLGEPLDAKHTRLRHVLVMHPSGAARLTWPLIFRPLHNALIEDALDRAALAVGAQPAAPPWSDWVRLLRGVFQAYRGLQRRSNSESADVLRRRK